MNKESMKSIPSILSKESQSQSINIKKEHPPLSLGNSIQNDYASHNTLGDISAALISPGFSNHVMNDHSMREQIRLSLDVKSLQENLIQERLKAQVSQVQKILTRRPRKKPKGLTLSRQYDEITSAPRTAPLQGRHRRTFSLVHNSPRRRISSGGVTPPMVDHEIRLPPMTSVFPCRSCQTTSTAGVFRPTQLPSWHALMRTLPISPPTTSHAAQCYTADGLSTLSRAADLKSMKEEYLKACAAGFDALHGLA